LACATAFAFVRLGLLGGFWGAVAGAWAGAEKGAHALKARIRFSRLLRRPTRRPVRIRGQPCHCRETLGYFRQRVMELHGPQTPVLAMEDFNDEPFDTSLVRHALSIRQRAKVTSTRETCCYEISCGRSLVRPMAASASTTAQHARPVRGQQNMATGDALIKPTPPPYKSSNHQ
jgi:hypothetical protein